MRKYPIPRWAERGNLIWFGHYHEPPMFLTRKGDWHEYMEDFYKESHLERYVKKLARLGANNINTHFYKGDGLAAEAEHHRDIKKLIRICHKNGIKASAYVQFGSISQENLIEEVPEAASWGRLNIYGLHQTYGAQEFRWRACPSQKGWVEYLKKCCTVAIKEFGFDGIFFDNFSMLGWENPPGPADEPCYCDTCQQNFRDYLTEKYDDPEREFGIVSFNHVHIPHHLENCQDPLVREWFYFKDELLKNVLKELYGHIKSLDKNAVVGTNSSIMPTGNPYPMAEYNDIVFWEDLGFPRWGDGCLVNMAMPLKVSSALGVTLVKLGYTSAGGLKGAFWNEAGDFRLLLAEAFTFDAHSPQTPWMPKIPDETFKSARQYLDFFKSKNKLYHGFESAAPVCLLYPYRLFVYSFDKYWASFKGMIQILLQNQIPFDIIFPEQLESRLKNYDVLVLSDYLALSDAEAALIENYVRKGGGLFASGETSLADERFRFRNDYALAGTFGISFEEISRTGVRNCGVAKCGKGRVAFLPEVIERVQFLSIIDGKVLEDPRLEPWAHKVKCRLPERHYEVAAAVRNLPARGMPVEVLSSESVVCNLNRRGKILTVHLLNYDVANPQEDILVKINAVRYRVASAYAHVPEKKTKEKPAKLRCELKNGYYSVIVPKVEIYCCLEVRLK